MLVGGRCACVAVCGVLVVRLLCLVGVVGCGFGCCSVLVFGVVVCSRCRRVVLWLCLGRWATSSSLSVLLLLLMSLLSISVSMAVGFMVLSGLLLELLRLIL